MSVGVHVRKVNRLVVHPFYFENDGSRSVRTAGNHDSLVFHPAAHDGTALQPRVNVAGDGVPRLRAVRKGRPAGCLVRCGCCLLYTSIKDLCDETGCKVEFRTEKDDFVVVFYRNLRETWKAEQNNKDAEILKHQNDVLDDVLKDVLENQIIQLLIENNRYNQKQIAIKTGRSIASIQRAMKRLSEQGKIVREGGKRFGHWDVK